MIESSLILYPLLAMYILVALVLIRLGYYRITDVNNRKISPHYFKTYRGDKQPDLMQQASRNFINLFESPIFFYIIVLLFFFTEKVSSTAIIFAWIYVGLRYAHSFVHTTFNHVITRFALYVLSWIALHILWVLFFIS